VLRAAVRAYCRAWDVDLADYDVPEGGYPSFDAFFTRRLREGARVLDPDLGSVLSPADGRLEAAGRIDSGLVLEVKGQRIGIGELIGDPALGASFTGGWFGLVYLSPRDYHRVHAAVSGPVVKSTHLPGTLYPVNDVGLAHVPGLFVRNERVVVEQASERHGRVLTVLVGAFGVGRITLSFDAGVVTNDGSSAGTQHYAPKGPHLARGDELGVFHLGSTVVVLVGGPAPALEGVAQAGESVRMGRALCRTNQRRES
jgi:phosphatidylserine decarboxylase